MTVFSVRGQLEFDSHSSEESVCDERHLGSLRESDVLIDRYIDRKSAVARKIIGDPIHLSDFVSADIYRRLLLQPMEIRVETMERIGRREDIHSFQEVEAKEQEE